MRITDWLSPSSDWVSFTASATIIAMTMSVFEFSEHLRLDGTYQTSHGRPHCPISKSLLLSQILGLTTVNISELEATLPLALALPTTLEAGWVIGTVTLTQWQPLSVTLLVSLLVSYRNYPSLATGTNLCTWTRLGPLACVDVFRVNILFSI